MFPSPAPWTVELDRQHFLDFPYFIRAADGSEVARLLVKANSDYPDSEPTDEEWARLKANAALIIAAPKLYEACHLLLEAMTGVDAAVAVDTAQELLKSLRSDFASSAE